MDSNNIRGKILNFPKSLFSNKPKVQQNTQQVNAEVNNPVASESAPSQSNSQPAATLPPVPTAAPVNQVQPSVQAGFRSQPVILLIEDETLINRMYSKKLSDDGYEVVVATNGVDGVKYAKEKLPDMILCDIMMPEKDGLSTLNDLKADESTKSIPVVMLTNLADETYVTQALSLGAVSYLVKSQILPPDVVAKVKEVLEGSGKKPLVKA